MYISKIKIKGFRNFKENEILEPVKIFYLKMA